MGQGEQGFILGDTLGDLDADQLRAALGINESSLLTADPDDILDDVILENGK